MSPARSIAFSAYSIDLYCSTLHIAYMQDQEVCLADLCRMHKNGPRAEQLVHSGEVSHLHTRLYVVEICTWVSNMSSWRLNLRGLKTGGGGCGGSLGPSTVRPKAKAKSAPAAGPKSLPKSKAKLKSKGRGTKRKRN